MNTLDTHTYQNMELTAGHHAAEGIDRVGSGALMTSAHERSAALQRPPKSPGHSAATAQQLPPWALTDRPSRMMPRASSDTLLSVRHSSAA